MRFWDSSAIIALFLGEERGKALAHALHEDPHGMVWCLTPVEVRSALARRRRTGAITAPERESIWDRFTRLRGDFSEVDAVSHVRDQAQRLLDAHALRAGDALQLGAALVGARGRPETLAFVTLDRRLAEAASREGFPVFPAVTGEGIVAEDRPRAARRRRARTVMAAGR